MFYFMLEVSDFFPKFVVNSKGEKKCFLLIKSQTFSFNLLNL